MGQSAGQDVASSPAQTRDVTFGDWQALAFDTTMYWPLTELPLYERKFRRLKETDPRWQPKSSRT